MIDGDENKIDFKGDDNYWGDGKLNAITINICGERGDMSPIP